MLVPSLRITISIFWEALGTMASCVRKCSNADSGHHLQILRISGDLEGTLHKAALAVLAQCEAAL